MKVALSNNKNKLSSDIKTNVNQSSPKDTNPNSYNNFEFKELTLENKQLKKFIDEQAKTMARLQTDLKLNQEQL